MSDRAVEEPRIVTFYCGHSSSTVVLRDLYVSKCPSCQGDELRAERKRVLMEVADRIASMVQMDGSDPYAPEAGIEIVLKALAKDIRSGALLKEKPQAAPEMVGDSSKPRTPRVEMPVWNPAHPPSEEPQPEPPGVRFPSDKEIESAHRIVLSKMNLHAPSDCQREGGYLDFCCKCGKRLHGMPHNSCHIRPPKRKEVEEATK